MDRELAKQVINWTINAYDQMFQAGVDGDTILRKIPAEIILILADHDLHIKYESD